MTEDDIQYFKRYWNCYYEILKEIQQTPKARENRAKMRAVKPACYSKFNDGLAAKKAGVARGMEWMGWYGSEWARLVYLKRIEVGGEINADQENEIRRAVWAEYVRTQGQRQVRRFPALTYEDCLYGEYLLGDLPWPREPNVGSFEFELKKLRLKWGMLRAYREQFEKQYEPPEYMKYL